MILEKVIYQKFEKGDIPDLPRELFTGPIHVVTTENEAQKAVKFLLSEPLLGIDTETRPSFRRGEMHKVALLQVSAKNVCFLFRLNHMGISPSVKRLLENKDVKKIGVSLHDDILSLKRREDFTPGNFIDLQDHVKEIGILDLSLQKIYANIFHKKISKTQQLTNWESEVLDEKQKLYAATDAWACINIYEELQRLEATGEYQLISNVDEENA